MIERDITSPEFTEPEVVRPEEAFQGNLPQLRKISPVGRVLLAGVIFGGGGVGALTTIVQSALDRAQSEPTTSQVEPTRTPFPTQHATSAPNLPGDAGLQLWKGLNAPDVDGDGCPEDLDPDLAVKIGSESVENRTCEDK